MKIKLVLALLTAGMTLANTAAFGRKLYPVRGPLASQTTSPIFSGQIRRPMFGGALPTLLKSWTVANGEVLKGKCATVKASSLNTKTPGAPDSYPPQPNLAFAWDANLPYSVSLSRCPLSGILRSAKLLFFASDGDRSLT
jgi:hypothetical protein